MARSTPERILEAAEARFAEKGFSGTSMGEIADDVGIRTPSLYKHFATKQQLYEAVLTRLLDPYVDMLERLLVLPEDVEQAQRNLDAVVRHYYERPNLARLVQHAALAGGDEVELLMKRWFNPLFRRAAQLTPRLQHGGLDPQHRLYVVMAFHDLMSGYVTMAPLHRPLLGENPLSKPARERHLAFLKSLATALWYAPR
jgi:AcrR family transcriptional regulator